MGNKYPQIFLQKNAAFFMIFFVIKKNHAFFGINLGLFIALFMTKNDHKLMGIFYP